MDFDHSMAESLTVVAQYLHKLRSSLAAIDTRLLAEADRNGQSRQEVEQVSTTLREISQKVGVVDDSLQELQDKFGNQVSRLDRCLHDLGDDLGRQISELDRRTQESSISIEKNFREVNQGFDEVRMRVLRANDPVRSTGAVVESPQPSHHVAQEQCPNASTPPENVQGSSTATPLHSSDQLDYFMFELRFRGSTSLIKKRQASYLEVFRGREAVIDLGCGRGEFVQLLSENGVKVTGVDSNADMVSFCRDRGLCVVQADLFDFLGSLQDASLDGIFTAQVVEHFPLDRIFRLIQICAKKLKLGGVFVAETVNTNCPIALSNFYIDPTHVRPIPPALLQFIFEQAPFKIESLIFSSLTPGNEGPDPLTALSGIPNKNNLYQDYAVVGTRSQQ
jgi:O-antigen chain-terminating methyltransferase